jgi:hypothetical protein
MGLPHSNERGGGMNAATLPLWRDVWFQAKRERRAIVAQVLMADDSIRVVKFGPRGGWNYA